MSLLIAVILIPAILIRWPSLMSVKKQTYWSVKGFSLYSSLLLFLISWRKSAIVVVLLIFGATAWLFWENIDKGGFIVWSKKDEISINLRAPKGVTIEALDEIMRSFEGVIQDQGIVNETQTVIDEFGGYGHIKITFPDSINSIKPLVLKQHLISKAVNYAGVSIYISGFGIPYYNGGYRVGAMYNTILQVTGPDYYRLWEIGENIIAIAKTDIRVNEGIISPSIRNLYKSDLKEITFEGQTKKIWQDRFSIASIKSSAQPVFNKHSWQSETVINNKRYPLKIQYGEELPELVSLKRGYLQIDKNSSIPISDYFTIKKESIQPWIDKKNQQYRFTVAWQYRGPERMRKQHEQSIVQSLSLPPGYALEEQQWGFLTKKEETNLLFLLGVIGLGMFMILTALYESFSKPLVIFFTVPFALIGVFLFYIVFERDFNINGYIGLIILFGVVVNNGIVLVERINQLIRKGMSLIDAAVQGGIERIRPIMITTTTTVGGLIPLLFLPSGNTTMAKILNELSFITIGGLMGSTLLTITMIPVVYVVVANMVNKKS